MHWTLSPEFSDMSAIDLRAHDAIIDRMLHIHLQRNHLFCLSPSEVLAIRNAIQFGPQATRVLDIILRRSQDYAASLRSASRYAVLLPTGSNARPPTGREFYIRSEDAGWWLEQTPALYLENAVSDGGIYSFIINNSLGLLGSTKDYVVIRPYHGGGHPLGAVIEELVGDRIQGICVCDRDRADAVPPFVVNSTGEKAHQVLQALGRVDASCLSSAQNPFFRFIATHGWGVENYIGPSLLELFFMHNPDSRSSQAAIYTAFPKFPNLSENELRQWMSINFKSQGQDPNTIRSGLVRRFGHNDIGDDRATRLASISIPANVIQFVNEYGKTGRLHRDLIAAFSRDMKSDVYRESVLELTAASIDALSADGQMNFA